MFSSRLSCAVLYIFVLDSCQNWPIMSFFYQVLRSSDGTVSGVVGCGVCRIIPAHVVGLHSFLVKADFSIIL